MLSNSVVSHCAVDKRPVSEVNKQVQTKDKVAIVTHLQRHTCPQVINEKKNAAVDGCYAAYGSLLGCKRHV